MSSASPSRPAFEYELVINRGAEHGVTLGMRFAVLNRKGLAVVDPETGENLGSIDVEKIVVEVARVEDRLAVGRTFRATRRNIGGLGLGLDVGRYFEPKKYVTSYETLEVDPATQSVVEIEEKDSYIKVGDPVKQVVGDEFLTDE